jgi:F-type H+-transporting ATPase subunit delta
MRAPDAANGQSEQNEVKTTKQSRRDAKDLFRSCMVNGQLDEDRVRQAVGKVLELKPRGHGGILNHFQRLVKLEVERRTAKIESAEPLARELQSAIQENLTRVYGPGLDFQLSENRELIGGLRIQVGSDVYDGSVQARLEELEGSF